MFHHRARTIQLRHLRFGIHKKKISSNLHAEVVTHNFIVHTVKSLRFLLSVKIIIWVLGKAERKMSEEKLRERDERNKYPWNIRHSCSIRKNTPQFHFPCGPTTSGKGKLVCMLRKDNQAESTSGADIDSGRRFNLCLPQCWPRLKSHSLSPNEKWLTLWLMLGKSSWTASNAHHSLFNYTSTIFFRSTAIMIFPSEKHLLSMPIYTLWWCRIIAKSIGEH
jgi:hypothetical protein